MDDTNLSGHITILNWSYNLNSDKGDTNIYVGDKNVLYFVIVYYSLFFCV